MNIKELQLKNFRSHKDTTIYFTESVYIILGTIKGTSKSNGSGKSSIVGAIKYALFGSTSSNGLIRNNEKEMGVVLIFDINGVDYRITRTVKRDNSPVLFINKKKYTVKAGQEVINNLLGANIDIYESTAYFKQGELNAFSKLTPKAAKDVVIKILQLGIYSEYEKSAKETLSVIKDTILKIKNTIDTTKEIIENEKEDQAESKYTKKDLKEYEELLNDLHFNNSLEKFLDNSKNKLLDCLSNRESEIRDNIRELEFTIKNKEDRINKLNKLSKEASCPTCEHTLDKDEIENIVNIINKELEPVIKNIGKYNKYSTKIIDMQKDVKNVDIDIPSDNSERDLISKIVEIKEELKVKEKDKKKVKDLESKIKKYNKELVVEEGLLNQYEKLQKAFGRNGIQAYIIENVIPEVQITSNDILKSLDTPIRISLDSQRELKKGGTAETLDINVITEYGERKYSNYSGGEKTFIDFALRMALSVILARRSNCQIQTLILDEVFGELDSVNKQIISRALKYVSNKFNFKKILIISHAEELQDACNNVIRVTYDGKVSNVTKENKDEAFARSI